MSGPDIVASITQITAENILRHYRDLLTPLYDHAVVDQLFICGPSARNPHVINFLKGELPDTVVLRPLDDIGIPSDANDEFCYAHLALETVLGRLTYRPDPDRALAEQPDEAVEGEIVRGRNWEELVNKVRVFSRGCALAVSKDINVVGGVEEGTWY
jgi:hypothetical protein